MTPKKESRTLESDVHYFRLWVHEMFLDHVRVLLSKREPLIHAHCSFLFNGNQEMVPLVLGPGQINGLQFNKSNIVALNHQILGPIPYFGGRTEVLLALFSV